MGQTEEAKPIIPRHRIPSGAMYDYGVVGRYWSQRPAFQDGGQFYDLEDGAPVADLKSFVLNDSDTQGAQLARTRFLETHVWYRMATTEELLADILKNYPECEACGHNLDDCTCSQG